MNGQTSFRRTRHMYPKQSMDIHVCSRTRTTSTAYACRQTYMWLVFYGPQKLRAQLRSSPTSKRKQEPLQVSPQEEKAGPPPNSPLYHSVYSYCSLTMYIITKLQSQQNYPITISKPIRSLILTIILHHFTRIIRMNLTILQKICLYPIF